MPRTGRDIGYLGPCAGSAGESKGWGVFWGTGWPQLSQTKPNLPDDPTILIPGVEILTQPMVEMCFEIFIAISSSQNDKYCMIPLICGT